MMDELTDAWMNMLDGHISVPVYKIDAPEDEKGNYVIVRPESGFDESNKRSLVERIIIITDVVTSFQNNIDASVAEGIDAAIMTLAKSNPQSTGLSNPSGLQVLNIKRVTNDPLIQEDGINKYYRKVSRYEHSIHKT